MSNGNPRQVRRDLLNPSLVALDAKLAALSNDSGHPSMAPERLLRDPVGNCPFDPFLAAVDGKAEFRSSVWLARFASPVRSHPGPIEVFVEPDASCGKRSRNSSFPRSYRIVA